MEISRSLVLAMALLPATASIMVAQNSPRRPSTPGAAIECIRNESECLARLKGTASRQGPTLRVKLKNGRTQVYRDKEKGCAEEKMDECISYRLISYHPTTGIFAVAVSDYECPWVKVHDGGGQQLPVRGIPYFSPNGSHFAAEDTNPQCGGDDYDIAIWTTAGDPPPLAWKYNGRNGASPDRPAFFEIAGWDGEGRIRLGQPQGDDGDLKPVGEVVRASAGWEVRFFPEQR